MTFMRAALLALLAGWLAPAQATLMIEITQGAEGALPIAIVPFGWEGQGGAPVDVAGIVAADLRRSGRFAPLPERSLVARPTEAAQVRHGDWKALGVENVVVGRLRAMGPDAYAVQFQLLDVLRGTQLAGYSVPSTGANLRRTAHYVADLIYEKLTGERGAFNTRIAYVTAVTDAQGKEQYTLQVADADGHGPQVILRSAQPMMSPAWSPDGGRIAYVSFENRRSAIYVQDIATGRRDRIAAHPGVNGAPAWSPDGTRLAMALSKDGALNLYVHDLRDRSLRRITTGRAIDTEPNWSPDGRQIIFTSDRGGKPQVYRVGSTGGTPERLTFEGDYNARPTYSPDGKHVAMVHGQGPRYMIAVLELSSGALRVLTDGALDESPSFAPNGSMILYAARAQGRGTLAAVSVNGRVRQRLTLQEGDVREPAWAPFEPNPSP